MAKRNSQKIYANADSEKEPWRLIYGLKSFSIACWRTVVGIKDRVVFHSRYNWRARLEILVGLVGLIITGWSIFSFGAYVSVISALLTAGAAFDSLKRYFYAELVASELPIPTKFLEANRENIIEVGKSKVLTDRKFNQMLDGCENPIVTLKDNYILHTA